MTQVRAYEEALRWIPRINSTLATKWEIDNLAQKIWSGEVTIADLELIATGKHPKLTRTTDSLMTWEHGEHSGTITFPSDERGPVKIDWDGDCPEDWEDIEEELLKQLPTT